ILSASYTTTIPAVFLVILLPPISTLFPYTTLFRSFLQSSTDGRPTSLKRLVSAPCRTASCVTRPISRRTRSSCLPSSISAPMSRSEEHTSELQSRENLVCRLLLEKKKQQERLCIS